eukprot:g8850.t1
MANRQLSDARDTITTRDDEGRHEGSTDDDTHQNTTSPNGVRELTFGTHVCPEEYINAFTPMEFEEIANLFDKYDEDRSGELDIPEMCKLMLESDMDYDETSARKLLEELDEDKSGLIDFQEFCAFIARIKAGDSKLKGFAVLTETLNTTSIGVLEEQCIKRHLKASYEIVEERPATAMTPHKHFVMEVKKTWRWYAPMLFELMKQVRLEGEWTEPGSDGRVVRSVGLRRFQGIGKTTREGRMNAAEAALKKLRDMMPGLDVPQGVIPKAWERWLKENARKGVELNRLLAQLRSKGFAPFANPEMMQWALATGSLDRLVESHRGGTPTVEDGAELRPEWRAWIDHSLRYGKAECCELLAFHGEETVRHVISDRIPVADKPFSKIMEEAFPWMLKDKLRSNETHRFRKEWIYDAVLWCRAQMYSSKRTILPEPSQELVDYVVGRFDPDPDAGFWHLNAGHPPTFVPSVVEPWHLSVMLRHIFRLAVCSSKDNRGWSALHQACVENRVCSHEETIRVLVHYHQLNLFQTDLNGKLAVELLFSFEGGRPNTPSGSKEKEGLLMDQRKEIMAEARERQDVEDEEEKERFRVATLLTIRQKSVDMAPELWLATQEASVHLRTLGGWMEYMDPETLNRFYYQNELVLRVSPEDAKTKGGKVGGALAQPKNDRTSNSPPATASTAPSTSPSTASSPPDTRANTPGSAAGGARGAIVSRGTNSSVPGGRSGGGGGGGGGDNDDEEMVDEESVDHFQWEKPEEFSRAEAVLLGWASVINGSEFIRTHAGRYNSVLDKRSGVVFYVDTSNEVYLLVPPREATLTSAFERSEATGRVLGQRREWEVRVDSDGNEFYCMETTARVRKGRVVEEVLTRDLRWDRPVEAVPPVDLTAGDHPLCTMDVAGYERAEQPWYICHECDAEWKHDMEMFREEVVATSLEKRCTAADEKASLDMAQAMMMASPPVMAYVPDRWPDGRAKDLCGWQGVFFWKTGFVVREISDDWYMVRIHGRAAEEEGSSADEQELPKPKSLEWEFPKERLFMVGTPVFFFHEERRECSWDPPAETSLQSSSWSSWATPRKAGDVDPTTVETPSSEAAAAAAAAATATAGTTATSVEVAVVTNGQSGNVAPREGVSLGRGGATNSGRNIGSSAVIVPSADEGEGGASLAAAAAEDEDAFFGDAADSAGTHASRGPPSMVIQTFKCGYPPLCMEEWEAMAAAAKVVCIRGRYTTYLDRDSASLFFHDEVQDKDDDIWQEFQDRTTGLHFFYCPELMKSRFHPPDLPPPSAEKGILKARLKEGDRVAYKFRGDSWQSTAEVVRVRETNEKTDAGDTVATIHYDVRECQTAPTPPGSSSGASVLSGMGASTALSVGGSSKRGSASKNSEGPRTARWVKRQLLTRAPRSAEEIALDEKEMVWRQELAVAKVRRKKELAKQAELSYKVDRLRKRGPAGLFLTRRERGQTALQTAERSAKRAKAEKALRDEEARLALIEAQKVSQELQAAKIRQAKKNKKRQKRELQKNSSKLLPPSSKGSKHQQKPDQARPQDPSEANPHASADAGGGAAIVPAIVENTTHHGSDEIVVSTMRENEFGELEEPQRRGDEEDRVVVWTEALRESLRTREDKVTTPRTVNRRRLIRMVHMAMVRQADGFVACEWGCRAWVRLGQDKFFHETEQCCKRIVACELGCGLRRREEEWLSPSLVNPAVPCQQHHEEAECPRRLVPCGQRCGEWLPFEDLMKHMKVSCVKRPFPPVKCRLGCGEEFHGGLHRMLQSEEERIDHEHELCPHRLLHCVWAGCEEMVKAKDRRKHSEEHVIRTGVSLYTVPGKYTYKVPPGCRSLKVQAWGAGGGSGHFKGGQSGDGGGGAFAEALLYVTPDDELEVTVGGGGSAGEYGSEIEVPGGMDDFGKAIFDMVDRHGTAEGGWPGGGAGHGGNLHWAAGGGGGYSMISVYGGGRTEPLVVAGAGGGGGSRAGVPGGGLNGEIPGTKIDMRNGRMGTSTYGGEGGDSGDINGCTFPPEHGQAWTGGNGGQYGGGGGSG